MSKPNNKERLEVLQTLPRLKPVKGPIAAAPAEVAPANAGLAANGAAGVGTRQATCHPDQKHHAKGLCRFCYKAADNAARRHGAPAAPNADAAVAEQLKDLLSAQPAPTGALLLDESERCIELFFEAYRIVGSVATAAKKAGVSMRTINARSKASPEFAERLAETKNSFLDDLEYSLVEMARNRGNVIAAIARLRADRPGRFLEKAQLNQIIVNSSHAYEPSHEEINKLLRECVQDLMPETIARLGLPPAPDKIIDVPIEVLKNGN